MMIDEEKNDQQQHKHQLQVLRERQQQLLQDILEPLGNLSMNPLNYSSNHDVDLDTMVKDFRGRLGGKCTKHPDRPVTSYCQLHYSVLCIDCLLSDHRHCIDNIETIESKVEKTKEMSSDIEGTFDALATRIGVCRSRQKTSLEKLIDLENSLQTGIRKLKLNLIEQANKKASEALEVVISVMSDKKDAVSADLKFLDELHVRLEAVSHIVQGEDESLLSDLCNYMKVVDTLSAVEKEYNGKQIRNHDVKCRFYVSPVLQQFKRKFTSFGELCLEERVVDRTAIYLSPNSKCGAYEDAEEVYDNIFMEIPDETMRSNSATSGRYTSIESDHRDTFMQPPALPPVTERPVLKSVSKVVPRRIPGRTNQTPLHHSNIANNLSTTHCEFSMLEKKHTQKSNSTDATERSGSTTFEVNIKKICKAVGLPIPPMPERKSHYIKTHETDITVQPNEIPNQTNTDEETFPLFPFYSHSPIQSTSTSSTKDVVPVTKYVAEAAMTKDTRTTISQALDTRVTPEDQRNMAATCLESDSRDSGITDASYDPQDPVLGECPRPPAPHTGSGQIAPYCVKTLFPDSNSSKGDADSLTEFGSENTVSSTVSGSTHPDIPRRNREQEHGNVEQCSTQNTSFKQYRRTLSNSDPNIINSANNDVLVDTLVSACSNIEMRYTERSRDFSHHRRCHFYEYPSSDSTDFNYSLQQIDTGSKDDSTSQRSTEMNAKKSVIDIFINFAMNRPPVITDLTLFDNDSIVLCDNSNDSVILTNKNGNLVDVYGISQPFGCVWMNDDRVAITSITRRSVCILYVAGAKLHFQREVTFVSSAVALFGISFSGSIFCVACPSSVKILSPDLQEIKTVMSYKFVKNTRWPLASKSTQPKPLLVGIQHVACEWTEERQFVYVCDVRKEKVVCVDMRGVVKWCQQLINPRGLDFLDGELIVACRKELTIIEACSGLFLREVKIDHIKYPTCLAVEGQSGSGRIFVPACTAKGFLKITVCQLHERDP